MSKNKKISSPFVYSTDPDFKPVEDQPEMHAEIPKAQQKVRVLLQTKHRAGKKLLRYLITWLPARRKESK